MRCVHTPNNADKLVLEESGAKTKHSSEQIEKDLLNARILYCSATAKMCH